MKKAVNFLYLLVCFISAYTAENVTYVRYPAFTMLESQDTVYSIFVRKNGLIDSIKTNDKNIAELRTVLKDDTLFINKVDSVGKGTPANLISQIKCEENTVYLKGGTGIYREDAAEYKRVDIPTDAVNTIYEYDAVKLIRHDNNCIQEVFLKPQSGFSAYTFCKGELLSAYRKANNILYKLNYKQDIQDISIKKYENIAVGNNSDSFMPYGAEIHISGSLLTSIDMKVNVLNYFILKCMSSDLTEALFPILFADSFYEGTIEYTATSFLQEKNTAYKADNLRYFGKFPWASANGYGINDEITIDCKKNFPSALIFYNGFISHEKPYLFKDNSRLKRIEIENMVSKKIKIVELEDIKEKQVVSLEDILGKESSPGKIVIRIRDVYKGEKYTDLCVQAIIPVINIFTF